MKSIGLSDEVYQQLIKIKHKYETKQKNILSFDKIIQILISGDNNERRKKDKGYKARDD